MTCIIGMLDKENDCVWMGADSLGSNGYSKSVERHPKVFRYKERDDTIMGSTSTFRQIDLLKYDTTLFDKCDKYENKEVDHEYMVTKFIPKLQKLFEDGGIEETKNGIKSAGNFLIGIKNQLFEVQSDYSVLSSIDGYSSVGCGEDFAVGSLYTTEKTELSCSERIIKALESAEHHSPGVQRPFIILNTKDDKVITID